MDGYISPLVMVVKFKFEGIQCTSVDKSSTEEWTEVDLSDM